MKRFLIAVALMLFAAPAFADPIEYTITFTFTEGDPRVKVGTTHYTYDPVTGIFKDLIVRWTLDAGDRQDSFWGDFSRYGDIIQDLQRTGHRWSGGLEFFHAAFGFGYGDAYIMYNSSYEGRLVAHGTYTITESDKTAVPEPGTLTLLSIALAVGVVRFRKAKRSMDHHT
jgi:hypothetical protein